MNPSLRAYLLACLLGLLGVSQPLGSHANKWVDPDCKTESEGLLKQAQDLEPSSSRVTGPQDDAPPGSATPPYRSRGTRSPWPT